MLNVSHPLLKLTHRSISIVHFKYYKMYCNIYIYNSEHALALLAGPTAAHESDSGHHKA